MTLLQPCAHIQDKSTDTSDLPVYTSEEGLENHDNSLGDLDQVPSTEVQRDDRDSDNVSSSDGSYSEEIDYELDMEYIEAHGCPQSQAGYNGRGIHRTPEGWIKKVKYVKRSKKRLFNTESQSGQSD